MAFTYKRSLAGLAGHRHHCRHQDILTNMLNSIISFILASSYIVYSINIYLFFVRGWGEWVNQSKIGLAITDIFLKVICNFKWSFYAQSCSQLCKYNYLFLVYILGINILLFIKSWCDNLRISLQLASKWLRSLLCF